MAEKKEVGNHPITLVFLLFVFRLEGFPSRDVDLGRATPLPLSKLRPPIREVP